jgi:hypothetical protein
MRTFRLIFCLLLAFGAASCDLIEAPYYDPEYIAQLPADEQCLLAAGQEDPFGPGSAPIVKKVLLEEMTGHKCGNCPRANDKAYALSQQHAGHLVVVSIHSGPLATFSPTASKYFSNYTTPEGDQVYQTLNSLNAVPFGLIDRQASGSDFQAWPGYVEQRLQEAAEAGIRIFSCYDSASRDLGVVVDLLYLQPGSASDRLSVWLVEDEIVDWQKDYTLSNPDIPDYVHHRVLRASLNGAWGSPLSGQDIAAGQRFRQSFRYDLPAYINPAKLHVVAFLHNADSRAVRQVEDKALMP